MRALAKLLLCELLKLRRKPLFWVMAASSVGLPLAFAVFLSDPADSESAVIQLMATMIQLSAYVVLIPPWRCWPPTCCLRNRTATR